MPTLNSQLRWPPRGRQLPGAGNAHRPSQLGVLASDRLPDWELGVTQACPACAWAVRSCRSRSTASSVGRRLGRLERAGDLERPSGGLHHRLDVDAGMDARQRQLLRHRIGRQDAEVGDHGGRPLAGQTQLRAAVAAVEMTGRGHEVELLDERARVLPQRDQHFLARRRDLGRAAGAGQPRRRLA